MIYRLADVLVSDFFRSLRLLAEDRLAEIARIRQRFFAGARELTGVDRTTLLQQVRHGEVVVIDVRPVSEYRAAPISDAVSIPLHDLTRRLAHLPRDKTIVEYCRGPYCVLAAEAVQLLSHHGFRAYRLEDSVDDWRARGLPVHVSPRTVVEARR